MEKTAQAIQQRGLRRRLIAGSAALLTLGLGYYFVVRGLGSLHLAHLIPEAATHEAALTLPGILMSVTDSLPTFLHVFALILLTGAFTDTRSTHNRFRICSSWFLINLVFEVGQLAGPTDAAGTLPVVGNYLAAGTFSLLDVGAAVAGSIAGYLLLNKQNKSEADHD